MPSQREIIDAREQFMTKLRELLNSNRIQATFNAGCGGIFVIDEEGGGWGYFLDVSNLAIADAPL